MRMEGISPSMRISSCAIVLEYLYITPFASHIAGLFFSFCYACTAFPGVWQDGRLPHWKEA